MKTLQLSSALLTCAVLVLAPGCDKDSNTDTNAPLARTSTDLVARSANYAIEDGRTIRIPSYRGTTPVLGQCINAINYELAPRSCIGDRRPDAVEVVVLDRQDLRVSAQLMSVNTQISVDASSQKVENKVSVAKHRLFIEWARYRTYSLNPFHIENQDKTYVSGIELGVGIRVIMDVTLTGVSADANLNFGFGKVAAQVAMGNAQVEIQYDTIGVPEDILPPGLPIAIESVNDMTTMMRGLYGAVEIISRKWNDHIDEFTPFDVRVVNDDTARVTFDHFAEFESSLKTADGRAAPVPFMLSNAADTKSKTHLCHIAELVISASDHLSKLEGKGKGKEKALLRALYNDDGKPLISTSKCPSDTIPDIKFQEPLIKSIAEYHLALRKIEETIAENADPEAVAALSKAYDTVMRDKEMPREFSSSAQVRRVLAPYYPVLSHGEAILFPSGFTAGPIAYYVARTEGNILRDNCEERRIVLALRHERPDAKDKETCGEYWKDAYSFDLDQAWCDAKLLELTTAQKYPGPILRHKLRERCDWMSADEFADLAQGLVDKLEKAIAAYPSSDSFDSSEVKNRLKKLQDAIDEAKLESPDVNDIGNGRLPLLVEHYELKRDDLLEKLIVDRAKQFLDSSDKDKLTKHLKAMEEVIPKDNEALQAILKHYESESKVPVQGSVAELSATE